MGGCTLYLDVPEVGEPIEVLSGVDGKTAGRVAGAIASLPIAGSFSLRIDVNPYDGGSEEQRRPQPQGGGKGGGGKATPGHAGGAGQR